MLERFQSLFLHTQLAVEVAQVGIGIDQLGVEVDSPAVARDGSLGISLILLGQGQVVARASIVGVQRNRVLKGISRDIIVFFLRGNITFIGPLLLFRAGVQAHEAILTGILVQHIPSIVHTISFLLYLLTFEMCVI